MCCGIALAKTDKPSMYLVMIVLTRTTRFFLTAAISSDVGRHMWTGSYDKGRTHPVLDRSSAGVRLCLYMFSSDPRWSDMTIRTYKSLLIYVITPELIICDTVTYPRG